MVVGLGFEPRLAVPETAVLPLDDPTLSLFAFNGTGNYTSLTSLRQGKIY
jgi:hypothetical protein